MCTVTWRIDPDRLQLFFNRDERRTRLPGVPPAFHRLHGVGYVAPTDGDAGGTWIGVNEFGLAACLVNPYFAPPPPPPAAPRSRGLLLAGLLDCPTRERLKDRLAAVCLDPYPPFQLGAFVADREPWLWTWDGRCLGCDTLGPDRLPLSTSSYRTDEVLAVRKETFHKLVGVDGAADMDRMRAFHRYHDPSRPAHSVCMSRPDARTVSYTEVTADAREVSLRYLANPLEASVAAEPVEIRLARFRASGSLPDRCEPG